MAEALHINSSSGAAVRQIPKFQAACSPASAPVIGVRPAAPGRHEAFQQLSRLVTMTLDSPVTLTMLLIKRPEINWHQRYVPPDTTQGNTLNTIIYTFSSSWSWNALPPGISDLNSRDQATSRVQLNIYWAAVVCLQYQLLLEAAMISAMQKTRTESRNLIIKTESTAKHRIPQQLPKYGCNFYKSGVSLPF